MKPIHLDPAEPRCRNRARSCEHASKCARNRAAMPASGAVVADFSLHLALMAYGGGLHSYCAKFSEVSFDAPAAPEAAVKPAIGARA